MPIYEYACSSCGFEKDYLQKMSEPVLTDCPACNQATLYKKLSAPGFQLKGSGWYATDFKGGSSSAASKPATETESKTESVAATSVPSATGSGDSGSSGSSSGKAPPAPLDR